ncbi:hypothetical protein [Paracoccus sp. (in: a-proteobacteria)]|uniref:hypothetical protein n=1 Tax=Paracoccus sp. TaxID=267 RepID=UPI0026DFEA0F|nr:hypothetical protein [Paracoccus sp. (in: a-proteobacteria)]MDO5646553.1 hypothetical protein [Paracoccus sp. (in: a-proteobacteria)]
MIDPPRLISPAIPLLLSLRKFHPNATIIPYVPQGKMDQIPDRVLRFHNDHCAPIRELTQSLNFNHSRYNKPYLHGYKILAAAEERDTEYCIFLDTDTYLNQPFDDAIILHRDAVSVVPESVAGYARRFTEIWDATYAIFGLTTPTERVRMLRTDREHPPYFNAGFVAFPETTPSGQRFGKVWLETAMTLDYDASVNHEAKRPWLDQASLPVAILRAGCRSNILPPEFNYPVDKNIPPSDAVRLYHYHGIERLQEADHTADIESLLVDSGMFTSLEHYLAPREKMRAEAAVYWKEIADLADKRRAIKAKLQNPDNDPDFSASPIRKEIQSLKKKEAELRTECDKIVEALYYDDAWLMPQRA